VLLTGLAPLAGADARILVLGSMPGAASLAAGSYYAHPANLFWPLLAELLAEDPPQAPAQRRAMLVRHRIALWDVVRQCARRGSLDAHIVAGSVVANDLGAFISGHPHIRDVFFNGAAAQRLFRRHLQATLDAQHPRLRYTRLPSSSPANAAIGRTQKLAAWRAVVEALSD
jgi:double-stranded uracil-DNA glycosylase